MNLMPVNYPSVLSPLGGILFEDAQQAARSSWGVDEVRLNRAYTTRLKVFTPSKYCGPIQIYNSFPVAIGSPYRFPLVSAPATENDTGSFLQSVDLEPESEDNLQWVATLNYAPFDVYHQLGSSDVGQGLINPLDRAPEVFWSRAKFERVKTEDEGTPPLPFVNTVGDPLLDPPRTEETRPVLRIARNESTYNDAYTSQFKDTTNLGEFLGYPPNTVKCSDITGSDRIYDADWGYYFKVTYEFEFRDDDDGNGYTELVLNAGYRQLAGGTGSPVNVLDANGATVTDAVPLQSDGSYQPSARPYFLQFTMFPAVDFSQLNIPDDILTQNS